MISSHILFHHSLFIMMICMFATTHDIWWTYYEFVNANKLFRLVICFDLHMRFFVIPNINGI